MREEGSRQSCTRDSVNEKLVGTDDGEEEIFVVIVPRQGCSVEGYSWYDVEERVRVQPRKR